MRLITLIACTFLFNSCASIFTGTNSEVHSSIFQTQEYFSAGSHSEKEKGTTEIFQINLWNIVDTIKPVMISNEQVATLLKDLNQAFGQADIGFELLSAQNIYDNYYTYEDLVADNYKYYYEDLVSNNTPDVIDLYLVDHAESLCYNDGRVRGCRKGHGFTMTGGWISSIVLAKEDINEKKIPIHEFGHFFNLEHTHADYEKQVSSAECKTTGDYLCDTPPDPGAAAYGAMVNFTDCEMYGAYDEDGIAFKPIINNYMGYYPPCYMKEYIFTEGQINRMKSFVQNEKRRTFVNGSL